MAQFLAKFAALGPGFAIAILAFVVCFAFYSAIKYARRYAEKGRKAAKAASDAIDPTELELPAGGVRQVVANFSRQWKSQQGTGENKN